MLSGVCTLLFWRDAWGPGSATLAANRDEARDRPWTPPAPRSVDGRLATFPQDHRGGTWLGAHSGLLAALTNAPTAAPDPSRPSRGLLVRDVLGCADAASAVGLVGRRVAAAAHDGFNLLVAAADAAVVLSHAHGAVTVRELEPGLHVLDNHRLGARHHLSEPPEGAAAPRPGEEPAAFLRRTVRDLLARHEPTRLTDHEPCRHGAARGTLSAAAVHLDPAAPGRAVFLFAAGPPCTAELREVPLPA